MRPSSVSATPPVIEIYFLIGNDSTPRELSPLFPFSAPPLGGVGLSFHPFWPSGHLLSTPTGASMPFVVLRDSPPRLQHHDVVFHPFTPLLLQPRLAQARSAFSSFPSADGWEHGSR